MVKTLDDIFEDDGFGLLDARPRPNTIKSDEDRLIESFEEINAFVEKHDREPSNESMVEYTLLSKLNSMRNNQKHKEVLASYDRFGLLGKIIESKPISTIEEVIKDDSLGLLSNQEVDNSLYNFVHAPKVKEKRAESDFVARRKPMSEGEFSKYDALFKQVHKDLKENKREFLPFSDPETNLKEGNFYLVDGLLCYFRKSKAKKVIKKLKSGNRERLDGRIHVIFENGTQSNMLFRSLGKAILKNGKMVSAQNSTNEYNLSNGELAVSEDDKQSGWIYVLKSLHPKLQTIPNLYKIGFSEQRVEERIKNASKEATFLFADVQIVATYKCYNINIQNFEGLLHRFFAKVCLNVDVFDINGKRITPREWFVVPFQTIDKAIQMIMDGTIINYELDVDSMELIRKE